MRGKIPVTESRFFSRFMRDENLPYLIRLADEERNELNFLLTGVAPGNNFADYGSIYISVCRSVPSLESMVESIIPKTEIAANKKDMKEILQGIKPYFYELTGADEVKDPWIFVKTGLRIRDFIGLGRIMDKASILLSAAGAAVPLALGLGFPLAAASGLMYYSTCFITSAVLLYNSIKDERAVAFPVSFLDLICASKSNKIIASGILAHEYAHNVRMKTRHWKKSNSVFLEEGIATAVSNRVLDDMGDKQPVLRAHGKMQKIGFCLESVYSILHGICGSFEYIGGSAMVHLAEFKYGKGIYKDLFKGKYDCLLD
ncbi:MAG: hypothetical protein QME12_06870 [Nanoarchaeota archaeon]|nr:hypothetical protein [Nanoarchaeota archaeon]